MPTADYDISRQPLRQSDVVDLLEDPEKVTVAFLVAVGAAESGRPTVMFLMKEAVRLALDGVAVGVACEGCPSLPEPFTTTRATRPPAVGTTSAPSASMPRSWTPQPMIAGAELQGTVPLWQWIGDEGATTFSY